MTKGPRIGLSLLSGFAGSYMFTSVWYLILGEPAWVAFPVNPIMILIRTLVSLADPISLMFSAGFFWIAWHCLRSKPVTIAAHAGDTPR